MQTVAIFGVGLIGGSFGLALKKAGFRGEIVGVSSAATLDAARARGAIDRALPPEEAASRADLIYLAQPIFRILETLPLLNASVRPEALVTDAGSTKAAIVARAAETLTRCQFLGGHPLAGKEQRGVEHADPDLFRHRAYVLTPAADEDCRSRIASRFIEWLTRIGADLTYTTARIHDDIVAYTSHLPQLTATALAVCLSHAFPREAPPIFGPALVDITRLALSHFDIWGDILQTNQSAIDAALADYIGHLQQMRELLPKAELKQQFEEAARLARRVRDSD